MARKLGIASGQRVLLDGAPADLGLEVPSDTVVHRRVSSAGGKYEVIVCFCPAVERMARRWPVLHPLTPPDGALWIAWPKRSSGLQTDLDENVIREYALTHGRVDVKVCAIDDVWSGLKTVIRLADRLS